MYTVIISLFHFKYVLLICSHHSEAMSLDMKVSEEMSIYLLNGRQCINIEKMFIIVKIKQIMFEHYLGELSYGYQTMLLNMQCMGEKLCHLEEWKFLKDRHYVMPPSHASKGIGVLSEEN